MMKGEAQRPGSSEITTVGLYTYYLFSMSSDAYLKGVAVKITNQLQSFVIEVTVVDDLVLHVCYIQDCKAEEVFCTKLYQTKSPSGHIHCLWPT